MNILFFFFGVFIASMYYRGKLKRLKNENKILSERIDRINNESYNDIKNAIINAGIQI
jgi:hypothetical protein